MDIHRFSRLKASMPAATDVGTIFLFTSPMRLPPNSQQPDKSINAYSSLPYDCDFSRYRTHPFSHQLTQGAHPLLSF
jgi:hypothetical protein